MQHTALSIETRVAWGSRALRASLGGTVFLLLTGLAILLLPFDRGVQICVLAHTAGGVLFLAPLLAYLVPHLRKHALARWSHLALLGWMSGLLLGAGVVSGLVLTLEAAFGTRITYGWDVAHIVTGCAAVPVLGAHLITAVRKNRPGEGRHVVRLLALTTAVAAVLSVGAYAAGDLVTSPRQRAGLPAEYSRRYGANPFTPSLARTDWMYRIDQDRRWVAFLEGLAAKPLDATTEGLSAFLNAAGLAHRADEDARARGETHVDELHGLDADGVRIDALRAAVALPSVERTAALAALLPAVRADLERNEAAFRAQSGIAPEALAGSASCGTTGCHEQILREWEPSAHRYASRSAFFQLIQKSMADANGAESTRYCAGCHDPIALFSGAKNIYNEDLSSPGADEGVSCASCHSIVRTDVEGNAAFTMSPPVRYLAEDSFIGRFLIRAYPRHHVASYSRPLLSTPELCGACHKQFIDKELNRATRVQLQNQYDAWKGSHWFVPDPKNPQRPDAGKSLTCRDCHMRLETSADPMAWKRDGKHRHHGMIGANQWLPTYHALPGAEKHVRLTEDWLQGKTVLPEIADRWPGGPVVPMAITAPASARPGEPIRVRIALENSKVGHTFPTGPLDVIQAWVDVRAVQDGREIFRSGALDERGFIQEGAFQLKSEGVDRAGNLIDKHNLWDMVGARFRRAVAPGYSDQEEFTFECGCEQAPAKREGEVTIRTPDGHGDILITATLRYRKVNQTLINMLVPDGTAHAPVTDMTTATARVRVERRP